MLSVVLSFLQDSDLSSNPSRDSYSSFGDEEETGRVLVVPVKGRPEGMETGRSGRDIVKALEKKKKQSS